MEAIGRLAGGIAHDFNNLLTAILGYADMIAERLEASNDATRRDLREIRKAADRAASLTRQLLALSRKQFINPRVLDINETISDLLDMLTRVIGEHIHLVTRLDPAIGPVRVDPAQLEQVVMNLAINARDAMPNGGRLTISTSPAQLPSETRRVATRPLPEGPYVLLTFADTGSGIDPDTLTRVFEPFFTTKPKGRGTGLGLATVAAIVEQSGGVVTIQSEVGKGTTLRIYLPETSQPADEQGPADAVVDAPQHYGSECILLVEDHPAIRELAARALRRRGYIVYDEGSGDDALQWALASDVTPDLLVTDVVMPGMNGPALAAQLRQRNPAMRVLYMSGYSDDDETFLEGTGVALLQKPFTQADLVTHVRRTLERVPPS
jgi:CheY-like chemotaxis protein